MAAIDIKATNSLEVDADVQSVTGTTELAAMTNDFIARSSIVLDNVYFEKPGTSGITCTLVYADTTTETLFAYSSSDTDQDGNPITSGSPMTRPRSLPPNTTIRTVTTGGVSGTKLVRPTYQRLSK